MQYDATREALFYPMRRPPLSVTDHAWTLDARCAEFSRLVFFDFESNPAPLAAALAAHGFGRAAWFFDPDQDTAAFAAIDAEGTAMVCFRGTSISSFRNIANDLMAWPNRWPGGGWVHAGFKRAYANRVRDEILAWLDANPHRELVCTGISLGAALATLLAAERTGAQLVTFGSPRVGTGQFASRFDRSKVRRYVQCCDIVPSLPPPFGYRHAGAMRYVDRRGSVHAALPTLTARVGDKLLAHLWFIRRALFRKGRTVIRTASDHAPINYVTALLGIREN